MSMDQFKTFFWPTLKRLLETLIQEGCNPLVFWEGDVTSRLELIADIPAGKAVYHFERTDMQRAKEVLGGARVHPGQRAPLPVGGRQPVRRQSLLQAIDRNRGQGWRVHPGQRHRNR